MHIVDSCGWLEWFSDGPLADRYGTFLEDPQKILVPTIVIYEVYKILKREIGEEKALIATGRIQESEVVPLDPLIALHAADAALKHNLAIADAVIYATAETRNCTVVTSDSDLQGLPRVDFIPKRS